MNLEQRVRALDRFRHKEYFNYSNPRLIPAVILHGFTPEVARPFSAVVCAVRGAEKVGLLRWGGHSCLPYENLKSDYTCA